MNINDKFSTVHDDFFGNIVGTIASNIKGQSIEFITDWSLPAQAIVR